MALPDKGKLCERCRKARASFFGYRMWLCVECLMEKRVLSDD